MYTRHGLRLLMASQLLSALTVCAFAASFGRASNDGKRFEVYDRFDRKMVESRPSISRVSYGSGIPVGNNDLGYPASLPIGGQPEQSSLVSGLLVTRLASDSK